MARLIPAFMDDHTPPGERDVFGMLASGPDQWVAMHSLDLSPWNRGLRTEIDFVIIVPDTGILCVEVKSHENIRFENDRWNPPEIRRSPFKQASDARYTFFRRLRELAPRFRNVPIVHCCIFPKAIFEISPNLSVSQWEVMDSRVFRSFNCGDSFCDELKGRMKQAISADANLEPMVHPLSQNDVEAIIACCMPIQKRHPSVRDEIIRRGEQLEALLRDQQKPILNLACSNDRIIVSGGAGTGKTLVAMEIARRAATRGDRVALLCFNQLVGEWMKKQMTGDLPTMPNLVVGRAIHVLAEMTGIPIPVAPTAEFWEERLPRLLQERLADPDFAAIAAFDYLVLDEAQDILSRTHLWECLQRYLTGGIQNGRFALFGDFDNQVLSEQSTMDRALVELDQDARPARWQLGENCRNYRIIGDTAVRLCGFDRRVYSGYMRTGGSVQNYDIFFYENEEMQHNQLVRWINEYKSKGYKSSEITILSFCSADASAAAKFNENDLKLHPLWQNGDGPGYSSIHAFKGMENKVLILTDLVIGSTNFNRHLLYTGMTRATEAVRILCDTGSREILIGWFARKAVL